MYLPARTVLIFTLVVFGFIIADAQTVNFNSSSRTDLVDNTISGCAPLTLYFKNTSNGVPASPSWSWDLGNGNNASSADASATYTQPGSFTVKLTLNGGSSKSLVITIHDKPAITFGSTVTAGCAPLTVPFTNASTPGSGSISSYSWVFGDGGTSTAATPTYEYKQPGVYPVTLTIVNSFGCSSTLVKTNMITVKGPLVDFGATPVQFCSTPASVTFTNQTTGLAPLSYKWNFGDQSSEVTSVSIDHTYTTTGTYTVSLTATDGEGCKATNTKSNLVKINSEPGVDFSLSATQVCVGQAVTIFNKITVPVNSFSWDLGNGKLSSSLNPLTSYSQVGKYIVKLKASMPSGCEVIVAKEIEVTEPQPDFSISLSCNNIVTFQNQSVFYTYSQWDFGDGSTSLDPNPTHKYSTSGAYVVKLTSFNNLNCQKQIEKSITVNSNPTALIYPDQQNSCTELSLSGCAPFTLQFTNKSDGGSSALKSSAWIFGDNTSSTATSPSHTYNSAGTFNVMLVVTNALGCRDTARAVVHVSATTPTADFTTDKVEVCVNDQVKFSNLSQNSDFWCWDFGDMGTSTEKEPTYAYAKPGTYSVTLTAKHAGCSNIKTRTALIKVKDPFLDFAIAPKDCANPYDIKFINASENFQTASWDFGDGQTSNSMSTVVPHQYAATGVYDVTLKITNQTTGCSPDKKIKVTVQDIEADFEPAANPICKNSPVLFSDRSKFAAAWSWDFKDGNFQSVKDPVKSYANAGTYQVTLTVNDSDGCTDSKTIPVKVADMEGKFGFTATSTCDELTVQFADQSIANPAITNWHWDFGNGETLSDQNPVYVYKQLDSYTVKLTIENAEAICTVVTNDAIVFTNPVPEFSTPLPSACVNAPVTFFNESAYAQTFIWDFGNDKTSTAIMPSMAYASPGIYTVTLKAKDVYGCEKSKIRSSYISVLKPTADFEAFQTSAECPPLITTFKDKSSSDVVKWQWRFGDGQSSVLQNSTNTYVKPGNYDVSLQVTNSIGCPAEAVVKGLVSVGGPYGEYQINTPILCTNVPVDFAATTTNTVKYIWDFGDGMVRENDSSRVMHTYTKAASLTPSLTLVDSKGCKVVIGNNQNIQIKESSEVDFDISPEYPFEQEQVTLTAKTEEDLNLNWLIDNEKIGIEKVVQTQFEQYGKYRATLIGTNSFGCSAFVVKEILVQGDVNEIPNVFTPNGTDSFNEKFVIDDTEKGFWELKIYNRWGGLVHSESPYQNGWDGGNNSSGVYFYHLINIYRKDKQYRGFVQVMR